ncbi:hypothetical protein N7530_010856 [Penicillium desertorum]|uniref:Uncharacterized protein n=1 Tax=Penicillium desertorum TaxID=1303715 RepID=A0A9W9WG52_9EURO|nr:hypothetical protein N7530_010856 [Penicillium desertorum]
MRNKRRVFLSLHHRNSLSLGGNRQRCGYAAYHWGIFISPKSPSRPDCYAFDVSNGVVLDPVHRVNLNEEGNWHFREKVNNPDQDSLLGRVMIGKVPHEVTYAQIRDLLESIPLPQKDALPEQNCVTWTRAAIRKLRENGLAEQFDLDRFMDESLAFADQRLHTGSTPTSINYTTRPM